VLIEQESDGGYSVYVPELPGCVSQRDTWEEALGNIKEAIALYLWSLEEFTAMIPAKPSPARASWYII
jgi:predicted RNase H-like HicB family nuclease